MPERNAETHPRDVRIVVSLLLFLVATKRSYAYNHRTMTHPTPIDITNIPELVRIAEEVEATKTPRKLVRENKTVAVIMPAKKALPRKKREKTKADYEAFVYATLIEG